MSLNCPNGYKAARGWILPAFAMLLILFLVAVTIPAWWPQPDINCLKSLRHDLGQMETLREGIEEYWHENGDLPNSLSSVDHYDIQLTEGSRFELENGGVIVVIIGEHCGKHAGKPIRIIPTPMDSVLTWSCRHNVPVDTRCGG